MKHKIFEKRLKTAAEGTVRPQLAVSQQSISHFKFQPDFFQGLILSSDVQPQPLQEMASEKAGFKMHCEKLQL